MCELYSFRVIFTLFLLMGVLWLMEIISFWVGGSAYIWILFDLINICSAIFIFIMFILKPKIYKLLKIKCPCLSRLDPYCPSFLLEESSNHYRSKRRSHFPNQQQQQTESTNCNSEDCSTNGRNMSATSFSQISE